MEAHKRAAEPTGIDDTTVIILLPNYPRGILFEISEVDWVCGILLEFNKA